MNRIASIATVMVALIAGIAPAQGKGTATPKKTAPKRTPSQTATRLDRLLGELAKVPAKEWQAKLRSIETEIAKLDAEHKRLLDAAKQLQGRATRAKTRADRLRAYRGNLQSMRVHLGPSGQPKARPRAAQKEPEKMATAKPAVAKAQPKKAPGNPAQPKKAPPKKSAPKAQPKKAPQKEAPAKRTDTRKLITFADVLPVFEDQCIVCHDEGDASGGLDLSSFAAARQGGGSGATLAPGNPDGSRLFRLVARTERPFMPKDDDPLTKPQLALIRQWILDGATNSQADAREFVAARTAKQQAEAARAAARAKKQRPLPPPTLPDALPESQRGSAALADVASAPTISALAASPRAPFVALAGHRQVVLWSLTQRRVLGTLPFEYGDIEVLRFDRGGTELLAAGGEPGRRGHAVLYDVKSGAIRARFRAQRDTILAADLSPDRQHIALSGPSKHIEVFDRSGQRLYRIAKAHRDWVLDLCFGPDGRHLASAGRDGSVGVFLADSGRDVHSLEGHTGAVHAVRFSPDGNTLVSGGADGTLRRWNVRDGKAAGSTRAHRGDVTALDIDTKGRVASTGRDGTVQLHDLGGKALRKTKGVGEWLYGVAWSADGQSVVAGDFRGRLVTVDLKTKTAPRTATPALPTADGVAR